MKSVKAQIKVKKNDTVQVLTGKDKGKSGKVMTVDVSKGRLTVEGLNLRIKHVRPRQEGEKGQRVEFPAPLAISNVMVVCPKCSKPARLGWQLLEGDKKKARACRKCNETID